MKRFILIIFAFLVCAGIFAPCTALASEEIHSSYNNVTVLPAKFDLSSTHGQTITQSLRIVNDSDDEYLYALSINNISVMGENGEVGLGDGTSMLSNLFASWIETDEPSGKLEARATKIINFSIKVPEITDPGGKYASMVISLDKILRNPGESSGMAKVVSLIMLNVAGDYEDSAKLISFRSARNSEGRYVFETRVRNHGVSHIKPQGHIVIYNLFGQEIDQIEHTGDNVLPGSIRRTITEWEPQKYLYGIYHATLVANYGQTNSETISGVLYLYVFPFWPTLFILVALAIGIYYLTLWLKNRKPK